MDDALSFLRVAVENGVSEASRPSANILVACAADGTGCRLEPHPVAGRCSGGGMRKGPPGAPRRLPAGAVVAEAMDHVHSVGLARYPVAFMVPQSCECVARCDGIEGAAPVKPQVTGEFLGAAAEGTVRLLESWGLW